MSQKDVGNKVPIYKLKKTDEVMKYYDEWGEGNKYDKDMVDWNYTGPKETTEVFIKYEKNKDLDINNESSSKQSDTYFEVILSSGKKLSYTFSEQKKLIKDLENIKL